jgi:hypothetical protein
LVKVAKELKIKIIIVVGNHEYRGPQDSYFGKSIISALFSDLEHLGIHVIDEVARAISLSPELAFIGLPYRETEEQFRASCWEPLQKQLTEKEFENKKFLVGWHVGIPFGEGYEIYAGDENSNNWIAPEHEIIKALINLSIDKTIYCGHYHGPSKHIPCGEGFFFYIGSPVTRTRTEHGQIKRTVSWEDGKLTFHPTNLDFDYIASSIDDAIAHQNRLVHDFGEDVLFISKIAVNLGAKATRNEFDIAQAQASAYQNIFVDPVNEEIKSKVNDLFQKVKEDTSFSQKDLQVSIVKRALALHYFSQKIEKINEEQIFQLAAVDADFWLDLVWKSKQGEVNEKLELEKEMLKIKTHNPDLYLAMKEILTEINYNLETFFKMIIAVQDLNRIIESSI